MTVCPPAFGSEGLMMGMTSEAQLLAAWVRHMRGRADRQGVIVSEGRGRVWGDDRALSEVSRGPRGSASTRSRH